MLFQNEDIWIQVHKLIARIEQARIRGLQKPVHSLDQARLLQVMKYSVTSSNKNKSPGSRAQLEPVQISALTQKKLGLGKNQLCSKDLKNSDSEKKREKMGFQKRFLQQSDICLVSTLINLARFEPRSTKKKKFQISLHSKFGVGCNYHHFFPDQSKIRYLGRRRLRHQPIYF